MAVEYTPEQLEIIAASIREFLGPGLYELQPLISFEVSSDRLEDVARKIASILSRPSSPDPDKKTFTIKSMRYYPEAKRGKVDNFSEYLNDHLYRDMWLVYEKKGNERIFYPDYPDEIDYRKFPRFSDFVLDDRYGPRMVKPGRSSLRICKKQGSGGIHEQVRIRFASVHERNTWVDFYKKHFLRRN